MCRGNATDGSDREKADEYEMYVKKEFQKMKRSGVLGNLEVIDKRGAESGAAADMSKEIMMLRYRGFTVPVLPEDHIDRRQKKNKIHTWPGCCKVANVFNAPRLAPYCLNKRGEDRAKIIQDQGQWCRERSQENFVMPKTRFPSDW